jgi:hypothetical protein
MFCVNQRIVNDGPEMFTDELWPEKQNSYGGGLPIRVARKEKDPRLWQRLLKPGVIHLLHELNGGEIGIRTLGTASGSTDFESAAFDHSAISP